MPAEMLQCGFEDRVAAELKKARKFCAAAKPPCEETDEYAQRLQAAMRRFQPPAEPANNAMPEDVPSGGPVGDGNHVVADGECTSSIARRSGHFWETIWNAAENAGVREVRKDPNVLCAGDRIYVPPIRRKCEPGATKVRHRFVRRGEPSKLRMVLRCGGEPRSNEPYVLEVDSRVYQGTLDAEGKLECAIAGDARRATLTVGEGARRKVYPLHLGTLDPISELSGVQARLNNLGFACGQPDGAWSARARDAMQRFQARYELPRTDTPDEPTRAKIREVHGY